MTSSFEEVTKKQGNKKEVALFGEILADIFPDKHVMGGAPFNVARHLNAFNLNPLLITRTGNDDLKNQLLHEMHSSGLNTAGVQHDPFHPTGQVTVELKNGNPSYTILPNQAYDYIHAGMTHMTIIANKPQLAYFGTLAQRALKSRLALDVFLSDGKCPKFLDVNLRKPWYDKHTISRSLLRSDIVKLNESELDEISQLCMLKGKNPPQKAIALLEKFEIKKVIVTCGPGGSWVIDDERNMIIAVPEDDEIKIEDTVGAGDAFSSVFILGLLEGWDTLLILQRANQFAKAICGIRGAVPSNLSFYSPFRLDWNL